MSKLSLADFKAKGIKSWKNISSGCVMLCKVYSRTWKPVLAKAEEGEERESNNGECTNVPLLHYGDDRWLIVESVNDRTHTLGNQPEN
jgi:hypothetical protein